MATEAEIKAAIQAVDGVRINTADHTRGLSACLVYELLTANVVRDIVLAALVAAEQVRGEG
jgi:hypothetical protein